MVRYIKVWNPKTNKLVKVKTYIKPKGFKNFTDLSEKKDLIKSGYKVKVGKNPYSGKGGKVLYYKKKR